MKTSHLLSMLLILSMQPILSMENDTQEKTNHPVAVDPTHALYMVCKQTAPNPDLIELFLNYKADVNATIEGSTALLTAIDQEESDETAENRKQAIRLLAHKATEQHRATALALATRQERWLALEVLQEDGLDAVLTDDDLADGWDLAVQDARELAGKAISATHKATKRGWAALEQLASGIKTRLFDANEETLLVRCQVSAPLEEDNAAIITTNTTPIEGYAKTKKLD